MRKMTMSAIILLVLSISGFSLTSGNLEGRVYDLEGNPLANVSVQVLDSSISTQTSDDGTFILKNLNQEKLSLFFEHPDYFSQTVPINLTENSGRPLQVSLVLKNPILMTIREEISVTAEADSIIDISLPSHRTILPQSTLAEMGTATLTESVERVPGVTAVGKGGFSMSPAIRGLAEHRTLLLVDGIRITSERRIGANASFVNLNDIDRIEINRGPYSVFHGSGALGGVINIITKSPVPYAPLKGNIFLSYNTVRSERAGSASLSGSFGKWGWMLDADGKKADDYDTPSGPMPWSRYSDYNFMFKLNRKGEKSEFFTTLLNYRGIDIGKPSPTARLKPRWYPEETNQLLSVGYKVQDFWTFDNLTASIFANRSDLETQKDNFDETDTGLSLNKRNLAVVEGTNFGFKLRGGKALGDVHTLNLGLDFFGRTGIKDRNTEWRYDMAGLITRQTDETSLQDAKRNNFGFYIDDKIQVSDSITLNAGGRIDLVRSSNSGNDQDPIRRNDEFYSLYMGSVYQITHELSLLANVGRSFRFPSVSELFYSGLTGRGTIFGNPDLIPEKSLNFDLGLRYLSSKFFASIYAFSNTIDDMIQKYGNAETEEYFYRNLSRGHIYGVEGEFYSSLMDDVEIFLTFHHMKGTEKGTSGSLDYIPPTRFTVWGKYSPGDFWIEPKLTFSAHKTDPGPLEMEIDGYTLFETIVGLEINENLTVMAIAQNILNKTFRYSADVDGVDAPGRGIVFRARYKF